MMANEMNMRQYTIEKSTDGPRLVRTGSVAATGITAYKFMDMSAPSGTLFYRVNGTGTSGDISYSGVASVSSAYAKPRYVVVPNPIERLEVHSWFQSRQAGTYTVRLMSHSGQQVLQTVVQHAGATVKQSMKLPGGLARGLTS